MCVCVCLYNYIFVCVCMCVCMFVGVCSYVYACVYIMRMLARECVRANSCTNEECDIPNTQKIRKLKRERNANRGKERSVVSIFGRKVSP